MSEKDIIYLEKQARDAQDDGDQESEFEARADLADAKAWKRREEEGHW